jgi:hypothetical protein
MTMPITHLRGEACGSGRTCPSLNIKRDADGSSFVLVGKRVTNPADLAQLAIGDDEVAIEFPLSLLPEVSDSAG